METCLGIAGIQSNSLSEWSCLLWMLLVAVLPAGGDDFSSILVQVTR